MILQSTDRRAERLFTSLPRALRMPATRAQFPHVLARIAAEWEVPRRFLQLMDELLIDQRGGRAGFPFECTLEMANLREYYVKQVQRGQASRSRSIPASDWR
ncbi:MAG: hypothetical protein KJZ98_15010 [Burkholderiaceae bacterium]|jgi:hypothetical protein|nr:hypothetical protein [Burkholderiaceae bacterium]MEB2352257.1 hypothetical protein [Burkholderiaceae bacterium]